METQTITVGSAPENRLCGFKSSIHVPDANQDRLDNQEEAKPDPGGNICTARTLAVQNWLNHFKPKIPQS